MPPPEIEAIHLEALQPSGAVCHRERLPERNVADR